MICAKGPGYDQQAFPNISKGPLGKGLTHITPTPVEPIYILGIGEGLEEAANRARQIDWHGLGYLFKPGSEISAY